MKDRLEIKERSSEMNIYPLDIRRFPEVVEITLKSGEQVLVPGGTWLTSVRKLGYDLKDVAKAINI
jgi:hypothetical protein